MDSATSGLAVPPAANLSTWVLIMVVEASDLPGKPCTFWMVRLVIAPMPADKNFHPIQVTHFGAQAIVLGPQNLPQLLQHADQLGDIGDGSGGHQEHCNCIRYMQSE
jgi:hypothetical protein